MKIKKDDLVIITTGSDKGKKGRVLKSMPKKEMVIVEGVNIAKKHQKATRDQAPAIVEKTLPIHASNCALIDPKDGKAVKIAYKTQKDGKKVRVSKRSGEVI